MTEDEKLRYVCTFANSCNASSCALMALAPPRLRPRAAKVRQNEKAAAVKTDMCEHICMRQAGMLRLHDNSKDWSRLDGGRRRWVWGAARRAAGCRSDDEIASRTESRSGGASGGTVDR